MGISGISPGQLLLIFLIVALLFGTKKLQTMGEDLGKAFKGFRNGMKEIQNAPEKPKQSTSDS